MDDGYILTSVSVAVEELHQIYAVWLVLTAFDDIWELLLSTSNIYSAFIIYNIQIDFI